MNASAKGWKDVPAGGLMLEAGSAERYETGDWRTYRPVWDRDKCKHCMICWVYCPDSSIIVRDGKMVCIDYKHCKGCGICAHECPVKCIDMKLESEIEDRGASGARACGEAGGK